MLYDYVDRLIDNVDGQIARDGFAEMRMNYLALTTDTVAKYATGTSRTLLENEESAVSWRESIRTLAEWTLIGRHFSWVIPLVLKFPLLPLRLVLPGFARIVGLHRVSTSSY